MTTYTFHATSQRDLLAWLASELEELGLKGVKQTGGSVLFEGTLEDAYRACLWSRLANRVWLPLGTFPAANGEELYDAAKNINWLDHMDPFQTMAVHCMVRKSKIDHSHFASLKIKDAIVDQIRDEAGERPSVELEEPDVSIHASLIQDEVTFGIDLAGRSLHRRGYRIEGSFAPLKETLAAAMLWRAEWQKLMQAGQLFDPMCGSGTFLIEAALMAGDIAPNLNRTYYGFLGWKGHDAKAWEKLQEEALRRRDKGIKKIPTIFGIDSDGRAVNVARRNLERAGLSGKIKVYQQRFQDFRGLEDKTDTGLVIVNPPYGERLGVTEELQNLYAELGQQMKTHFAGWNASVITSNKELATRLGLKAHRRNVVNNGKLKCELLQFKIDAKRTLRETRPEVVARDTEQALAEGPQMLFNRLNKNLKRLKKWVKKNNIEAYRLYDKDLPEYAAAIDIYADHVHLQEYAPPKIIEEHKAQKRRIEMVQGVGRFMVESLGLDPDNLHVKTRERQRGTNQYEKNSEMGQRFRIQENGLTFLVNFTDYLDTGLFLDHRNARAMIRDMAAGKDFLNLFAYTGSATVYAAAGDAKSTTTVDMSNTYLDWGEDNLRVNNLLGRQHRFIRADCIDWLYQTNELFDVIFLDPPTFSNSKKMDSTFDIQRDHVNLLELTAKHLKPGGTLIFSNNRRGFKLDADALPNLVFEEITHKTKPDDFARNNHVHRAWRITHQS